MIKIKSVLCGFLSSLGIFFFLFHYYSAPVSFEGFAARLPIRFFPFLDVPLIHAEIEKKHYSLLLDLGSATQVDLQKKWLDQLEKKEQIESFHFVDFKGTEYKVPGFLVPQVILKNGVTLKDGPINEESIDFLTKGGPIWPKKGLRNWKKHIELQFVDGRVGWKILKHNVSLFDFSRSVLLVTDDFYSLMKQGVYSSGDFVSVPFELKNCGVVLPFETDLGIKQFVLDTGATRSCIRRSCVPEEEATEFDRDKWLYVNRKFSCGGRDLESNLFILIDLTDKFECDGILGADFFEKHVVCLDFPNSTAYIQFQGKRPSAWERFICWCHGVLA